MPDLPTSTLGLVLDEAAPDAAGQVAALRALGWRGAEIRRVDGTLLADLDDAAFAALAGALEAASAEVVAVAANVGGWGRSTGTPLDLDRAELRALAPRAHALGARLVRVMSFANDGLSEEAWADEAIRRLGVLAADAEELGLVLVHENCAGWAGTSAAASAQLVRAVDSPALRLLFDTGNGLSYGYEAPAFLREVLPWVVHVHVKDGVREAGGDVRYVPPGEGEAGVAECLALLAAEGYAGALVLEPHVYVAPHAGQHVAPPEALDAVAACGAALERLLGSARPMEAGRA